MEKCDLIKELLTIYNGLGVTIEPRSVTGGILKGTKHKNIKKRTYATICDNIIKETIKLSIRHRLIALENENIKKELEILKKEIGVVR